MKQFIFMYHGGRKPESQEEGRAQMENWRQWVAELGDKVVNSGTPLGKSQTVGGNDLVDDAADPVNGYMIVKAEDFDQAIEIAKTDPFFKMDGSIEVAEMMGM